MPGTVLVHTISDDSLVNGDPQFAPTTNPPTVAGRLVSIHKNLLTAIAVCVCWMLECALTIILRQKMVKLVVLRGGKLQQKGMRACCPALAECS